ncbi:MAG TPA: hypothetical protein PLN52_14820 [Opitutaceae bacterium]|nr:hypothetical protein [Opitutaceae bacterium]
MLPSAVFKRPRLGRHQIVMVVLALFGLTSLSLLGQTPPAPSTTSAAKSKGPAKDGKPAETPPGPATRETLLSEVIAPPEFDVQVFATPDQANYPVYVAVSPDGTAYVASDGNSSLGTDPNRGRILRLRDTDDDGRADEVKVFAEVDSPRGLVWDVDRIYLMHPPHLSAFIDHNGDGVADEQKILVKNIGWGLKDRPADHASNGVTLGIDGWLYLAIGDFGFMEAEGTDGRTLQFRGGGVVRVRTDGTGLELFSQGTRNIVEVAVSPLLDAIARDNTNDGDGWDVRLHQFTGLEDHGYPTLYKNFPEESISPLMDYGGGSGCGAQWVDEPGIPAKWRGAMTVDWGREAVFHHALTPQGAAFTPTQEQFVKLPRATDLDVDARSRIYVSSWRGGKFSYAGPDIGYLVRLDPKGYQAPAVPKFAQLSDAELVQLFQSESARIRLEAQRTLLRRDIRSSVAGLTALATSSSASLPSRVLALFTLKQAQGVASHALLNRLAKDPSIAAWAIRALTDHEAQGEAIDPNVLIAGIKSSQPRIQLEATVAIGRLAKPELAHHLIRLLGSEDPVIRHTAVRALIRLRAANDCFAVVDLTDVSEVQRAHALQVLQALHETNVVDGLISRLKAERQPARRDGLVRALARLYYVEGAWNGSGWGTRPDTRGPYYQPERWAESEKINTVLGDLLETASGEVAANLNAIFTRYRVTPGDIIGKLLTLAATDDSLLPALTEQLVASDSIPASALPLLIKAAQPAPLPAAKPGAKPPQPKPGPAQVNAMLALIKMGTREAVQAVLDALPAVPKNGSRGDAASDKVSNAFFLSSSLENQHRVVMAQAASQAGASSDWADAALLHLANRKFGSPEAREAAKAALDSGWANPARRAQIIRGAALGRDSSRATAIVAALDDPDPSVASAAQATAKSLKLDLDAIRAESTSQEPLMATLSAEEILSQVSTLKGNRSRGEALFTDAGCIACHTTRTSEPLRGPFLGNISSLYRRRELAEAIIDPNKTIAQGFVTHQFTLKDGSSKLGFVTREGSEVVAIRDITGKAEEVRVSDIAERHHLPISLMPAGLMSNYRVRDLANLIDYLESLGATGN